MDLNNTVTSVSGVPIAVADVIIHLKSTGAFRNAVYELIEVEVVKQHCRAHAIETDPNELESYAVGRRRQLGVADPIAMNNYCRWLGVTFEQWSRSIEDDLLRQKLARRVVTEEALHENNVRHAETLRSVTLSRIVCGTRADADALLAVIRRGECEFFAVAREHSLEESTRRVGGYLGTVTRGILAAEVDDAVFAESATGTLVGPFNENGGWTLYEVMQIAECAVDNERVRAQMFRTWLDNQVRQARP